MGITNTTADELVEGFRGTPRNDHGKLRYLNFNVSALALQADVGSTILLANLPQGSIKLLPSLCRITNSAAGAGVTLNIGHDAYMKADGVNGEASQEAQNLTAFTPDPIDLADAADSNSISEKLKYDLYSKSGVPVLASVAGANLPAGNTISGYLVYVAE